MKFFFYKHLLIFLKSNIRNDKSVKDNIDINITVTPASFIKNHKIYCIIFLSNSIFK